MDIEMPGQSAREEYRKKRSAGRAINNPRRANPNIADWVKRMRAEQSKERGGEYERSSEDPQHN